MIDDIALGGIRWEELHMNPVAVDISQQAGSFFMPTEAVPEQQ
jgi:hypothetical protein